MQNPIFPYSAIIILCDAEIRACHSSTFGFSVVPITTTNRTTARTLTTKLYRNDRGDWISVITRLLQLIRLYLNHPQLTSFC